MRVAIDQARKDSNVAGFLPLRLRAALGTSQDIVVAYGGDPAALDEDGSVAPRAEGAKFRGVDDEPADAKQVVHNDAVRRTSERATRVATPDLWSDAGTKKIRAAHARRNNK